MYKNLIIRHADKGSWNFRDEDFRKNLSPEDAELMGWILKIDFSNLNDVPLKLEGVQRSLRLAEKIFQNLPPNCIFVVMDSQKPRARMTSRIITGKLHQLEQSSKQNSANEKRIDIVEVDSEELVNILNDASEETWQPYAEMMTEEGISEEEALAKWMNDMQVSKGKIDEKIHPSEAAGRYRNIIKILRERVTNAKVPIVFLGVGHSGALGQIRMENGLEKASKEDAPDFCEVFKFDNEGNLLNTEKTEI